jgi:hypothetical protein
MPEPFPSTGGAAGSGGSPATCELDEQGFATTTFDALCEWYRCPTHAADLVADLDCSEVVSEDADGITIVSGCGLDTVKLSGTGFTYEATFDAAQGVLTALRTRLEYLHERTGCTAYGFKAGEATPECAEEVRHRCVRRADPPGSANACREPAQAGCAACCTPYSNGIYSGCTVATSTTGPTKLYDAYWDQSGDSCACNCPPCADCTTEMEYRLRTLPNMPECDCPPVGAGGASGTGGGSASGGDFSTATPCEIHCSALGPLRAACPDVPH